MKKILFGLFASLFILSSCEKDDTKPGEEKYEWSFKAANQSYKGTVDSVVFEAVTGQSGVLDIYGLNASPNHNNDTLFTISVVTNTNTLQTGNYTMQTHPTLYFAFFDEDGTVEHIAHHAVSGTQFALQITKYDPVTKVLEGTFSGQASNIGANPLIDITEGKFKGRLK